MKTTTPRPAELSRVTLPVSGPIPDATIRYLLSPAASITPPDPPGHWSDAIVWALVGSIALSLIAVVVSQWR